MDPALGRSSWMPYVPLTLAQEDRTASGIALVDSGASVNVLPYEVGLRLGFDWETETMSVPLTGALARSEARIVFVQAQIEPFDPVMMIFAWAKEHLQPVILGEVNFLDLFDVFLSRSRGQFWVRPSGLCPRRRDAAFHRARRGGVELARDAAAQVRETPRVAGVAHRPGHPQRVLG